MSTQSSARGSSLVIAVAFVVLIVAALAAGGHAAPSRFFTTAGHEVRDPAGRPFLLHGFNRPSLEWQAEGDHLSPADVALMASWGANTIRIPTNQDFLLSDSCHSSPDYLTTLDTLVGWINAAGMNALIDLHWSDRDDPCIVKMGQQPMPDVRSLRYWQELAAHFQKSPHVFFDLYNEPHDVSWDCWLNGCDTGDGWRAVGMQQLYDTVRAAGFRNLVFISGLNWGRDLSGVPSHPVQGYSIAYATHPYYPDADPFTLNADFGSLAGTYPIVATEFGPSHGESTFCSPEVMSGFIRYFDAPDGNASNRVGWLAWAWYAAGDVCAFPAVISAWDGTPASNGVPVKTALANYR